MVFNLPNKAGAILLDMNGNEVWRFDHLEEVLYKEESEETYVHEVSWDGEILWDWLASDHIDEYGLSEDMRGIIIRTLFLKACRARAICWFSITAVRAVTGSQRLPNGNTMITEGADGRIFEVTSDGDIVWEYVSLFLGEDPPVNNGVYRAYRVPHDWVRQLDRPVETAVVPAAGTDVRVVPVKDED